MKQLLALTVEDIKSSAKVARLFGVLFLESAHRLAKGRPYILQKHMPALLRCAGAELDDLDFLVLARHPLLNLVSRDVGQLAAGSLDATETGEVVVDPPGFALALYKGNALIAESAAQAPLQVVLMLAIPLTGLGMRFEDVLHLTEGRSVDQRPMLAVGVLDPAVADRPDVVGICQDASEVASRQRPRGLLRGTPGSEAALFERRVQRVEGVGARGVGGKRPAQVRSAVGVGLHSAEELAGRLVALPHVEVADGGRSGGAAEPKLLVEAALDLHRQLLGVELGIGGGVAAHPLAERRLVEVLCRRNDFHPELFQLGGQHNVVVGVAGESRDVVDDHQVQVALLPNAFQERLELGPVGDAGRIAVIDVLRDHLGLKLTDAALASLPLRLDRIALLGKRSADLAIS